MADDKIETPLEELSNKDLQTKLVELGMPEDEAGKITTKAVLISIINTLKAKEATQKVDPANVVVNPTEEKKTDESWKTKAHRQWDYWDSQPKVKIIVPLAVKEKQGVIRWVTDPRMKRLVPIHVSGAIQPVTENGAQYLIPKGVYTEVPEPVARIIEQKFQQTSEAGKNILADRIDPETGHPVSDQL